VWVQSRNLRAVLCIFMVGVCTAGTTCSQGIPAFNHFEPRSHRIVPEVLVHNCLERYPNVGFLGLNDVAFAFADTDLAKPDVGWLGSPAGGCESYPTGLPAMRIPQSVPEQRNPCPAFLTALPGVSRDAGCARTVAAAEANDPVAGELSLLGKAGARIAQARAEVLSILHSENACTAWFETKDAAPADTFRSLSYSIDWRGPQDISQWEPQSQILIWRQPYVAQATQDGGPYTAITVNANGAFFRTLGNVEKVSLEGGPAQKGESRLLLVGPYAGNTPQAQIVTLLHELGHIVDLLPPDADNLDGKSVRNTDEVLQHCKTEIEAYSKHSRQTAQK
jgi:hypothetical protein